MLHRPDRVAAQEATFDDDIGGVERDQADDALREQRRRPRIHSTWTDPSHLEPRFWIYGRHYILGSVTGTIADGGVGKSSLVIAESVAMASGRNLLGVEPNGRQRVLYWNGEEPLDEIERRVYATCEHYKVEPAEITGWLSILSGYDLPIPIARADRNGITFDDDIVEEPRETMREHDIDVLIIDPFVRCHSVQENDNAAIQGVVQRWGKLAKERHASVELVHHSRKPPFGGQPEIGVADARGASAFIDAVRSARVLNRMTEKEGQQARVDNHRQYFRADNGKANYAPPSESATWFEFLSVTLPNGSDGAPDDDVGVVVPWHFPQPFDGVTTAHMLKVRALAAEGQYRIDAQSPDWIGRVVAEVVGLDPDDDKPRIKKLLKVWLANGVLKVVKRKDETRRERSFVEPGDWRD